MKKYLITGLINGIIFALAFPVISVLIAFSDFYGVSSSILALLMVVVYTIAMLFIWIKLKAEFRLKNILVLCLGCIMGMFVVSVIMRAGIVLGNFVFIAVLLIPYIIVSIKNKNIS